MVRKFQYWFDVRQDLLFNSFTIKEVVEKYRVSHAAVANHLKQNPRIKAAYYSRPWSTSGHKASAQMMIQFIPQKCSEAQEALEDIYTTEGPFIYDFTSPEYKAAMQHFAECERCQNFEYDLKQTKNAPFRFKCYSLRDLQDPPKTKDVQITEHFLVCPFCRIEYDAVHMIPGVENLISEEFDYFPYIGWDQFLRSFEKEEVASILTDPTFKREGMPPGLIRNVHNHKVKSYFQWRIFRTPIFELGLVT